MITLSKHGRLQVCFYTFLRRLLVTAAPGHVRRWCRINITATGIKRCTFLSKIAEKYGIWIIFSPFQSHIKILPAGGKAVPAEEGVYDKYSKLTLKNQNCPDGIVVRYVRDTCKGLVMSLEE